MSNKIFGQNIVNLANKHKTPFFFFSERQLIDNYNKIKNSFSKYYKNVRIDYSVKTDNEIAVLQILNKIGSSAEVVSAYEIEMCFKAGFEAKDIVFDGPCKTDEEIEYAINKKIHAIYADSEGEFERISKIARKLHSTIGVGLRINLKMKSVLEGPAETYIGKFGVDVDSAANVISQASKLPGINIIAISTHLGSQILDINHYTKAVGKMTHLAGILKSQGIKIKEINLGGGYPSKSLIKNTLPMFALSFLKIEYKQTVPNIEKYGNAISLAFKRGISRNSLDKIVLSCQPGRSISSSMGIMITKAKVVKDKWIFLDASTSSLPESIFFAKRRVVKISKTLGNREKRYNIAGKGLNSADNFAFDQKIGDTKEGDLFAILDAGAYSISRSNRFTILNPAIYMIRINGKIERIRRAENVRDLLGPMEFK